MYVSATPPRTTQSGALCISDIIYLANEKSNEAEDRRLRRGILFASRGCSSIGEWPRRRSGSWDAGCTCSLASSSCRCRGCCDVAAVVLLLLLLQLSSSSSPWTSKSRLHFPSHSAFVRSLLLAREASGSISFCLFFGAQQVQLLKIPEFAVGGKMSTKKNLLPMVRHDKQVVFKQNSALRILWY